MPSLLIAQPSGTTQTTRLTELVEALQREHGYQVLVVETPADALLHRLAEFATYLAYEALDGIVIAQPFVINWRPKTGAPAEIEFLPPPARLNTCAHPLLAVFRARLALPGAGYPPQHQESLGQRPSTLLHRFTSRGGLASRALLALGMNLLQLPYA